jgi:hypothetical protein
METIAGCGLRAEGKKALGETQCGSANSSAQLEGCPTFNGVRSALPGTCTTICWSENSPPRRAGQPDDSFHLQVLGEAITTPP